eukprot:CAMPEP_0177759892 /NCGR_PEP_ID=MMETSP0491_2-20121128/4974_1 /TAXON_ID=63592 /ORGANISM="Tetraselmis chuii, Strain PLY429" /LENGTH=391 /DNA_ID=CAMNT_0019275751 /DNA_START=65 /DNA_END=1240 /DNA_ORIENTATION=-
MRATRGCVYFMALVAALLLPAAVVANELNQPGVLLLDSPSRPFLREQSQNSDALLVDALPTLLSSLLGLPPSSTVSPEVAGQVDQLSLPNVFHKPSAVFTINIAGVDAGHGKEFLKKGQAGMLREVKSSAAEMMQGMDSLFPAISHTVDHLPLDFFAMQACDAACVEASLTKAAASVKGVYTSAAEYMNGTLQLQSAGREPVILKLSNDADRVFAMEMSNLHMTMTNIVSGMTARAAPVAGQATKYMDCTMMGLQMLRDTYGADSEEFQAAYESVVALTNNVMEDLCRCHGDRVMGQVNLLGDVAVERSSPANMMPVMEWREEAQPMRARMLQESAPAAVSEEDAGTNWSKGALLWVTFWILLWFTWMCIYALCTMPFKQDSLLYAKGKAE